MNKISAALILSVILTFVFISIISSPQTMMAFLIISFLLLMGWMGFILLINFLKRKS
jgi:hypothetical protein